MNSIIFNKCKQVLSLPKHYQFIVLIALILSIGLISSQRFFNSSLIYTLNDQSSALLTGDIEIASTRALSTENLAKVEDVLPTHQSSKRQIFSSMIQFYGTDTRIAEVVAIDDNYPLKGNCIAIDENGKKKPASDLLNKQSNTILISNELATTTDLTFGSTIKMGATTFKVVGIIIDEPDINIQSLTLGPRVYIHINNTDQLGFKDTMSKKYHSLFIALNDQSRVIDLTKILENQLDIKGTQKTVQGSYGPSQPVIVRNYRDINRDIIRGFDALNQFYFFLSIFILLLSGSALGFIIWTSILHSLADIGNLRFLGLSIQTIQTFYIRITFRIATITTIAGFLLGIGLSQTALALVSQQMNIPTGWLHLNFSDLFFLTAFTILAIMGITQIVLRIIHANRLFHEEQTSPTIRSVLAQILIGLFLFLSIFLYANDITLKNGLIIISLFIIIFVGLYGVDIFISNRLKKLHINHSVVSKMALRYLSESHTLRRIAFIAISFALITIFSIAHYESSLNNEFNPKNSQKVLPDLFVIDIYKHQIDSFKEIAGKESHYGPLIRTRIVSINGQSIESHIEKKSVNDAYFLYREQNLSTRKELYPSEELVSGNWFDPNNDIVEISIEKRFAKRIKLAIGDTIEFQFLGFPFYATISSIRNVDWGTFKPNFFMIIEPPYLDKIPYSWISSIKTPPSKNIYQLKSELNTAFPNISIIDIEKTSKKILGFLKSVVLAIKVGAFYCFTIGLLIFILLGKLFSEKRIENTIQLYWLGLSKEKIKTISLIENIVFTNIIFIVSGLFSAIIATILFQFFIPIDLKLNGVVYGVIWLILNGLVFAHSKFYEPKIVIGDNHV